MTGKRVALSFAAVVVVGACAVLWARPGQPPTLILQTPPAGTPAPAWPADQCWTWTFALPDRAAGDRIGLVVRQKSTPQPPGAGRALDMSEKAMSAAEADRSFGTALLVRPGDGPAETRGTASVQLIDLATASVASSVPGKSLRALGSVNLGGSTLILSGGDAVLDGKRFAGRSLGTGGTWTNGELYLMRFWVEGDGALTRYDVLLEQSADRAK
ncbi:MAG TPA: hypothetical protein VF796_27740 [Humisphaera sp.]